MARNIYQEVTDKIVSMLENNPGQFAQPWANLTSGTRLPRNIASGKAYRGVNVLSLWAAGAESRWWGTYQQWAEKGGQVRKGEKSSVIVFYKPIVKNREAQHPQGAGEDTPQDVFFALKYYSVFHAGQVDNIPAGVVPDAVATVPENPSQPIDAAEEFFGAIPAKLSHGGDRAFYSPSADRVQMPHFAQFAEPVAYYSTLAHEYVHWTGNASRLDRTMGKRFGDDAYAVEELVAELGAAFTMGMLELSSEPRVDHAQYLASWLRVLKKDAKAIFTVAGKAQAAAEYLAGFSVDAEEAEDAEAVAA